MQSTSNYPINRDESLVGRLTLGLRNLTTKDRKSLKSYGIACFSALHAAKTSDAITL